MGDVPELPKPPVPDLRQTLNRYLAGVKPVVNPTTYERCRQLVEDFSRPGGKGQKLQEALIQLAKNKENWVTHFWLDDMYLKVRLPLPVNSSPFFMLPKQQFHNFSDQLKFAARTVLFALEFKKKIDNKQIPPEVVPAGPGKTQLLCQKTYEQFFPAYRRPGEDKDELVMSTQQTWDKPLHIIVACKNQFFAVQVSVAGSEIISEDALVEQLRHIHQMARERAQKPPIGILTTENRTEWAVIRNKLLKKNVNGQSLQLIENSLLVLCLDDGSPDVPCYATIRKESTTLELTAMGAYLLHGEGTANRWYDKFLQVVITKSGVVGFIAEHSASEGITIVKFCEELLNAIKASELCGDSHRGHNKSSFPPPSPLQWDINDEIVGAIQEASKKMNKLYKDLDLFVHRFTKYGKEFIKQQHISPDAYIQLALQLTYYKVHRRLVSTYESASLRRFRYGRVDNIRATTEEALSWVKAMCDDQHVDEERKVELFEACAEKQMQIMRYTVHGEGPDNHLLALKELAVSSGMGVPELFQDKSYKEFLNFRLSTSQLPTAYEILVGYGPVVPDGYGCSYNPCPDRIDFCISSFFSSKETSSDFFAHSLEGSLLHMRELCLKRQQLKKKDQVDITAARDATPVKVEGWSSAASSPLEKHHTKLREEVDIRINSFT